MVKKKAVKKRVRGPAKRKLALQLRCEKLEELLERKKETTVAQKEHIETLKEQEKKLRESRFEFIRFLGEQKKENEKLNGDIKKLQTSLKERISQIINLEGQMVDLKREVEEDRQRERDLQQRSIGLKQAIAVLGGCDVVFPLGGS